MKSLTVEFLRFGDPTGIIRLSESYIRTIGTSGPATEARLILTQENLDNGMSALNYDNWNDHLSQTADRLVEDLTPRIAEFVLDGEEASIDPTNKDPLQLEIVSSAFELAQLPFEMLEETYPDLVVTRRIRQCWPLPEVNRE